MTFLRARARHLYTRLNPQGAAAWQMRTPRPYARSIFTAIKTLVILLFLYCAALAIFFPVYTRPPAHYQLLLDRVRASVEPGRANPHNQKVFIAANIISTELIQGAWGTSVTELVDILGPENVFLSIYQNDGDGQVVQALQDLGELVTCNTSIVAGAHIDLSQLSQVGLPSTLSQGLPIQNVTRVEYLSIVRNRALRPLDSGIDQTREDAGFRPAQETFDKILFLNDVYFVPADAANLLFSTNQGTDGVARYEAACAADFVSVTNYYDSYATRDIDGRGLGYGPGLRYFPWFAPGLSRQDVLRGSDAVRVRSCWGGMVAFNAFWFHRNLARQPVTDGEPRANTDLSASSAVRFRAEREAFWDASECCLIHADITEMYQKTGNSSSPLDTGIFLNPYVRTAYTAKTFSYLSTVARFENGITLLQYILTILTRYPEVSERKNEVAGQAVNRTVWRWNEAGSPPALNPARTWNNLWGVLNRQSRMGSELETSLARDGRYIQVEATAKPGGFCGTRGMELMLKQDGLLQANIKKEKNFLGFSAPPV